LVKAGMQLQWTSSNEQHTGSSQRLFQTLTAVGHSSPDLCV